MKRLTEQTLYEILEIRRDAPADEVEKAYERARALYGPGSLATYTLMEPDEAALLARRIEEARAVLLDPVMRAGYDAGLAPERPRETVRSRQIPPVVPPIRPRSSAVDSGNHPIQPSATESAAPATASVPPSLPIVPSPPPSTSADLVPEPPVAAGSSATTGEAPPPTVEVPIPEVVIEAPAVQAQVTAAPPARPELHRPVSPPTPAYAIPDGGPWTGEVLRRVRETRGLSLREISDRTKVTRYHLENIEADRYAKLPAAVYLRGILMSFAKELRLDGQRVSRSYLEQVAAAQAATQTPAKPR